MSRYTPTRNYLAAGLVAAGMCAFSAWCAMRWTPTLIPAALFFVSAALLLTLAGLPAIELHPHHLRIGRRVIPWADIKAVDFTGWSSPLVVSLTLPGGKRMRLIYPGSPESGLKLLRHLRRMANESLIDGVPWREYLRGESVSGARGSTARELASPRYPLLRKDDEEEVERLFQQLKTAGHLEPKNGPEEN